MGAVLPQQRHSIFEITSNRTKHSTWPDQGEPHLVAYCAVGYIVTLQLNAEKKPQRPLRLVVQGTYPARREQITCYFPFWIT
jgi:hypothetical protein